MIKLDHTVFESILHGELHPDKITQPTENQYSQAAIQSAEAGIFFQPQFNESLSPTFKAVLNAVQNTEIHNLLQELSSEGISEEEHFYTIHEYKQRYIYYSERFEEEENPIAVHCLLLLKSMHFELITRFPECFPDQPLEIDHIPKPLSLTLAFWKHHHQTIAQQLSDTSGTSALKYLYQAWEEQPDLKPDLEKLICQLENQLFFIHFPSTTQDSIQGIQQQLFQKFNSPFLPVDKLKAVTDQQAHFRKTFRSDWQTINPDERSHIRELAQWLESQESFYKSNLNIDFSKIEASNITKLQSELSVPELGYLLRLLADEGLIHHKHKTEIPRAFTHILLSKKLDPISEKNLYNKFTSPEGKAIDFWVDKLLHLRQQALKDQKNSGS